MRLPSRVTLGLVTPTLIVLLLCGSIARAGGGFDDPALVARLLPAVVALDLVVAGPSSPPSPEATGRREFASGFVVDSAGDIVTNGHAIDHAIAIKARFADGTTLPARLVWRAPIDLALLHVDAGRPLPTISWGDSSEVRPGAGVVAIGNPLGIGLSVSAGVVSAVGRNIPGMAQNDFIQTDAALNHGNSGGALFDLTGRVIGMTTGLLAPKGETGSIGIGLALPANEVRYAIASFRASGRLREGWLGAGLAPVTPAIAEGLALASPAGALVTTVPAQTPAEAGGVKVGDVIQHLGTLPVATPEALVQAIRTTPPGTRVHLGLLRDGTPHDVAVTIGEAARSGGHAVPPPAPAAVMADLGLQFAPLDPATRARARLLPTTQGIVVAAAAGGSPAAARGLAPGDVILRVQWQPVTGPEDVRAAISAAREGGRQYLVLMVAGPEGVRPVAIPLEGG